MTCDKPNPVRDLLASPLCDSLIECCAEKLGVVRRRRKLDVVCFVWTLIMGFGAGSKRTIASLRRTYQVMSGHRIARSAFFDRFTPELTKLLSRLLNEVLRQQREKVPRIFGERMRGFERILAMDATVLRLHHLLSDTFPGCRTNHSPAAAKLHMVMNVVDGSPNRIRITDERTGDAAPWKRIGSWVKGSLLIFDLGYYNFHLFHRIAQQKGYFLSRLKTNANPRIIKDLGGGAGRRIDVAGKRLQEILPRLRRKTFEAIVEVGFFKRSYKGQKRYMRRRFRLIAVRNDETNTYHVYLTNTDSEQITTEDVTEVYALRWQVELLFKQLRQMGRLGELPSSKEHIVKALIYGAILALALSNRLLEELRKKARGRAMPTTRFAEVFRTLSHQLLLELTAHRRQEKTDLFAMLLYEAIDPNLIRGRSSDILWEL